MLRKPLRLPRQQDPRSTVSPMTLTEGLRLGQRAGKLLAEHVAVIPRTAVEEGLTAAELDRIERRFGFAVSDDHRAFLATVLPVGPRWPDWRHGDEAQVRQQLTWPVEG